MRIAVISDIHGNAVALDAVLEDLTRDRVDRIVCLGDAIQGGPQPAEVVTRLRGLECPVVMENADAWLLSGVETGNETLDAQRLRIMQDVREWSLQRLGREDRSYIAGFAPTVEIPLERGRSLLCFHGSPASFDEVILPTTPEEDVRRTFQSHAGRFLSGGHTHIQFVRQLDDTFFFNPGSIGLAYRYHQTRPRPRLDPWAEYAVLASDGERLALEFRRVPFDVNALLSVYSSSGRPARRRRHRPLPGRARRVKRRVPAGAPRHRRARGRRRALLHPLAPVRRSLYIQPHG